MTSVLTLEPFSRVLVDASLTATLPEAVIHILVWLLVGFVIFVAVFLVKGGGPWERLMQLLRLLMHSGGPGDG